VSSVYWCDPHQYSPQIIYMTTHRWILGAAAAVALAATAAPATAQSIVGVRVFHLGARGGVSVPQGDFAGTDVDGLNATTGFNAGVLLAITPPALPLGLRIEGSYDRFGVDFGDVPELDGVDANWNILSGTVNATLAVPTAGPVQPYLIGGVGMYKTELKVSDAGSSFSVDDTQVGFNGGAGLRFRLGVISSFVEARFHTTTIELDLDEMGTTESQRINFVPVSFGIVF
jgi:opacity protein-like surface antigen